MATLTLRNVKGTPLTNQEADDNLANLLVAIGGTNSTPYTIPTPTGTGVPVLSINPTIVGTLSIGGPTLSTGDSSIELGSGRTGDGYAYIDLHTSAGTDYNLRLIRDPGINGGSALSTTGTGGLALRTEGAAPLYFQTNNTTRMTLDSSGNVGIGISTPSVKLDVAGTVYVRGSSSNGALLAITPDTNTGANGVVLAASFVSGGYGPLIFNTTNTERIRVDSLGNVGIGRSAPSAKLHVQNSTDGILNEPTGTWAAKIYQAADASTYNGLVVANRWAAETSTAFEVGSLYGNGTGAWTPFYKITGIGTSIWSQGSNVERMRLDSSGNFGIGANAPSEKLHVNGNILLENNFAIKQKMANGTATNLIAIDSSNSLRIVGGYSTTVHIHPDAAADTYLHFNNTGSVIVGNNTSATNMYIQNGSLTIGNGTINSGYKLQVNGSFAATTKSFVIDHPTKPDMKLRYGSLEGPENGVYVRGRLKDSNVIELPDYWTGLVDESTITVNLTAIGKSQDLWVDDIIDNTIIVGGSNVNCFYTVFAERKDVEKLVVEF